MGQKYVNQQTRERVFALVDQATGYGGIREVFTAIATIARDAQKEQASWADGAKHQWFLIEQVSSLIENLDFPDDYLIEEDYVERYNAPFDFDKEIE